MNSISTLPTQQFSFSNTSPSNPIKYYVEELSSHHDDIDLLDDFINEEDENGNSSLIFAALEGKEDLVRSLVDQGAFVNHQNHNGETALYWSASQGYPSIVDLLIESGANMNISNLDGASPAHVAAANGHCEVLKKLVSNGAYINSQDEDRDTALHYAVREGRKDVVEFLVKGCKARIDIRNEDEETALDLAKCLEAPCEGNYPEIIKLLQLETTSSSSPSPSSFYNYHHHSPASTSSPSASKYSNSTGLMNTANFPIF